MKKLCTMSGFMVLALTVAMPAMAADYVLVILNGRVMNPESKRERRP